MSGIWKMTDEGFAVTFIPVSDDHGQDHIAIAVATPTPRVLIGLLSTDAKKRARAHIALAMVAHDDLAAQRLTFRT
jgi:uncharacterized membrane protein